MNAAQKPEAFTAGIARSYSAKNLWKSRWPRSAAISTLESISVAIPTPPDGLLVDQVLYNRYIIFIGLGQCE